MHEYIQYMTYAYSEDKSKILHISEVESGSRCGCRCPYCGCKLVAKKGNIKAHHFAHESGNNCEYGFETSLHLAAKSILAQSKKLIIPASYICFDYKPKILYSEAKEIHIDKVSLETRFSNIVPDVLVQSGSNKLFIEIYVTHSVDVEKREKIKQMGISTIEINLRNYARDFSDNELENLLINDTDIKSWVYNKKTDQMYNCFCTAAEEKSLEPAASKNINFKTLFDIVGGSAEKELLVSNCPEADRISDKSSPYYRRFTFYKDDCQKCKYLIRGIKNDENTILCSGKRKIATINDLKRYYH